MFFRVFMSALIAGVLGGLVISAVQSVTTTPLILQAEIYEAALPASESEAPSKMSPETPAKTPATNGVHFHAPSAGAPHDHGAAWAPEDGMQRVFFTIITNIVAGFGFALLIVAGFALSGRRVDVTSGVLWGIGGFTAFTLAPGLGLPPELPGMATAELAARQGWWIFAALATALGLWLMIFTENILVRLAGVLSLVLPHAVGAPQSPTLTNAVPSELAAHFASSSIVTAAIFWVLLGSIAAMAYGWLDKPEEASPANQPESQD
jgi:cobalt transporter subunit CbtA